MNFKRFGGRRQWDAGSTGDNGEKLRRLIDGTSQGILVVDRGGRALFVNRAGAEMFGRREREILGWDSVAPLFADQESGRLDDLFAAPDKHGKRAEDFEIRGRRKDGAPLGLLVSAGVVAWDDGPARLLTITDITTRVAAETTRKRFMDALDHVAQGFTLWDADDRLLYRNQYQLDLHAAGADAFRVGRSFEAILRDLVGRGLFPEAAGREQAYVEDRLERHRRGTGGFVQRRDNSWLRVREEHLPDGSTLLTYSDMAEQVAAERSLREIESRFQAILDNTTAMIYLKDLDGRYMLANRNVTDLAAQGQIVGQTDGDLNGDTVAGALTANDREVLETGEAHDFEERLRFPDGRIRTYLSTKFPLRRETGEIYAIGGVSSDITLRKEMELALRQGEEKFRNLIDGSIQGVLIHDNPRVIYANAAAAEMFGCSVQDLLGIDVMTTVHPDDRERLDRFRRDRIRGAHVPARYQYRGVRRDDKPVWLEQIVRVIEWDGRPVYQNTVMDISVRKRHEDLRRQMTAQLVHEKERAEDASRTKSTFLASVSHELRTPLNAIIGFSEIMNRQMFGDLSDRYQSYADDIHASATHLLDLINDILDLSKIEAGKSELFEEEIDLTELVQTIERIIEPQARDKGISLTHRLPVPSPRIYADDRAVKQILINLVTNAVKFTPPGGEIRMTAEFTDGSLAIEVGDTGIGIPPEELALVFEPFRQGAGGHHYQEGTGLGLALVKSLAELHGAAVAIESMPGSGTTVRVTFPAERVVSGVEPDRRRRR